MHVTIYKLKEHMYPRIAKINFQNVWENKNAQLEEIMEAMATKRVLVAQSVETTNNLVKIFE
jgi:hypothetical protein